MSFPHSVERLGLRFGGKWSTAWWVEYSLVSAEYSLVSGVPSAPAWVSYFHLAPAQTQQETLAQSVQHYPSRGGVGGAAWVFGRNFFFFFCLFRATPMSCGGSQAGGLRATAASLHYSHSNARSRIEPATSWFLVGCFNHWAMMGTPAVTSLRSPFWSPHSLVPLGHSLKSEPRTPWAWTPFHQISAHSSVIQRAGNMNDKEN